MMVKYCNNDMKPISWRIKPLENDIYIGEIDNPVIASWFGGDNDSMDSGETASGIMTKGNPSVMGCALPFPTCIATKGSPIPKMPYKTTMVEVSAITNGIVSGKIVVPVIDVGPALDVNRPIDLTVAAFQDLGGDLKNGLMPVIIRIIGGAQYLLPF